jgi:hypothetical protein
MSNPRVAVSLIDLSDEELVALRHAADQELYRREVHRRAAQLVKEELRAANRSGSVTPQRTTNEATKLPGGDKPSATSEGEAGQVGWAERILRH